MFDFLVRLHLSMFFVLVTAGTLCTFWGLGLLLQHRRASKAVAPEQEGGTGQPASATVEAPAERASLPSPGRLPISPIYRSAIRVTGLLALIQAILGGVLILMGGHPKDQLHYVYGIVVLLAVPAASVYLTGKPEKAQRDLLVLVIAALIVAAAAVRAFMTGYP
jgi:hypothetical protein